MLPMKNDVSEVLSGFLSCVIRCSKIPLSIAHVDLHFFFGRLHWILDESLYGRLGFVAASTSQR